VEQVHDGDVAHSTLDTRYIRPVKIGSFGKLLLRQAQLEPLTLDGMAKWFPGIGDSCNHIPDLFGFSLPST